MVREIEELRAELRACQELVTEQATYMERALQLVRNQRPVTHGGASQEPEHAARAARAGRSTRP
jgi:hypothetical protein